MPESKVKTLSSSGPSFSPSIIEQSLDGSIDELPPGQIPVASDVINDKYHIDRLIARGGMGAVYAATHIVSGKRFALKWMLPALGQIRGARERFIREACATARISHPNIVDIYDVGHARGSVYLVMEFLRGETLADRMSHGRLNPQDAIALIMPALRGVAEAHAHGVVHRDLKPDNIFLCCTEAGDELEPKVLDFGISKITSDEVRNLALTHSGAVLGTPYYMSPEQVRGARNVDARTDVYAFGVILFEALAGQRPFDAETYNELILKIATEPAPTLLSLNPNLDPGLVSIVERAMARSANERFSNVETLALVLEPYAGGVRFRNGRQLSERGPVSGNFPVGSTRRPDEQSFAAPLPAALAPVPVTKAQAQDARRTRVSVAAAVLCLLIGLAAGGYWLRPQHKPVSVARPAPRSAPIVASPETLPTPAVPAPNVAEPPHGLSETSVSAAQVPPSEAAPPQSVSNKQARASAPRASSASNNNNRRPAAAANYQDKRPPPEPPAPDVNAAAAAATAKRAAPKDWDDRLQLDPSRMATSIDSPAGRIDTRDFR
jgi:serine/threonine-protein kinase